jgi:non-ribosomal peptide synthetase component F
MILSSYFLQVIGIMAIGIAGGIYCPLSPRDPQHRLDTLVQKTQSRLVIVDSLTKNKFNDNFIVLEIDLILATSNTNSDIDADRLSNVAVISETIAYVIFTSGSTGIPKAVSLLLFFNQLCFTFFTL